MEVIMERRTNGNGVGPTDVGIWYCTYYGENWDRVGGMGYVPCQYRPLCSNKPGDFRKYDATDIAVIDFHLQQIANAKIDFIIFELSPGGLGGYRPAMDSFVENARVVAARIKIWNENNDWKIRYAVAAGSHPDVYGETSVGLCMEKEAQDVYTTFYNNPEYGGPDSYYHLDGKPLLIYWGGIKVNQASWKEYKEDKTYGNAFTIRYAQDVIEGTYGWNIYESGTVVHSEVEVVSPGWGHYTRKEPPYVARKQGDFYQKCWDVVFQNPKPTIVVIATFNDYLENTAVWTADTEKVTDADKWYDHNNKLNPSMYWDMTVKNIKLLRSAENKS